MFKKPTWTHIPHRVLQQLRTCVILKHAQSSCFPLRLKLLCLLRRWREVMTKLRAGATERDVCASPGLTSSSSEFLSG